MTQTQTQTQKQIANKQESHVCDVAVTWPSSLGLPSHTVAAKLSQRNATAHAVLAVQVALSSV